MKQLLFVFISAAFINLGFSQSVTVTTNQTDTAKTTTTQKKRLVKVKSLRANAVQSGPVLRTNGNNNQSGTKEDEKSTTPQ